MHPKSLLHFHFILDHRYNGHHAYYNSFVQTSLFKKSFLICTYPIDNFLHRPSLINLRHLNTLLYPLELLINFFLCLFFLSFKPRSSVIHVHGVANIAPLIASRLLFYNTLWYLHECNKSFKILYHIANIIPLLPSPTVIIVSKEIESIYPVSQSTHIPGSIDTNFWIPKTTCTSSSTVRRFVTVANLNPGKGIHVLLDSLLYVDTPISLKVAGATLQTHFDYYKSLCSKVHFINQHTNHYVDLLGYQSSLQILHLFHDSEFFVLPSLTEAHPISLLQALSCGLPSIATNTGSCNDILPDCLRNQLIPPNNSHALSDQLSYFTSLSPSIYNEFSLSSRNHILANYSINHFTSRFSQLFSEL